ncbi:ankyrin repeat domain-containing protein [Wolbachia endosymbiont (group A) of Pogonocherus hispidulus]|uniref:ankyrin repeat domain-containing protein n=1 Tax=Wolbachia endosymbiont (group A) of Pogonocherus hispidulus TaxID=3066136 RepID=UPI003342030C
MTKKYVEKKDNVKETSNQDKRLYAMARHLHGKFNPPDTLHSAAEKGDFYLTVYILSKGADLNAQDECNWTPLHYAVYSGNVDIVRFLINQGANYNITDNEGTPVYYAFQYGHVRIVKYFIEEKGIDPMAPINEYGSTLFGEAIVGGGLDTIEYLMSRKDVTYDCSDLLKMAISNGHLDVVEYLVEEKGVDVNFVGENGWTPLLYAVERDYIEIVKYLIEMGAYINTTAKDGTTVLHIAAEDCNFDMVKCLVINGANINARDKNDNTPLYLATQDREYQDKDIKEDVKEYLISRGAHI